MLRLALPSNEELRDTTLSFLAAAGLPVDRSSARSLSAHLRTVPDVVTLFQRSVDIPAKVEEGTADLGIVGLDWFLEETAEGSNSILLIDDLGYGHCELALAVPEAWVDASSLFDLVDLSVTFREQGRELRVATKYPRLVRQFLFRRGLNYFSLVQTAGAMEAAPLMGYADVIADIVQSGVTLRENRLKTLTDGAVLASQAVLIGNVRTLTEDRSRLEAVRTLLELMEGHLRAGSFYSVTANVQGESPDTVAEAVLLYPDAAGIQGPTIARVYSKAVRGESWYAVTVVVERSKLVRAVDHLRRIGGSGITAMPTAYVFGPASTAYSRLQEADQPRQAR